MTPITHYFVHRSVKAMTLVALLATFYYSGEAQTPCTDNVPNPVISGKSWVCANEQTTYSTLSVSGSTWQWTLASGGQIISTNNNTVTIRWNYQPGTSGHKLSVKETNTNGCSKTVEYLVSIKDITLRCIGNFNVSVDNTCKTTLNTEWLLLAGHIGGSEMKMQILSGTTVLEEGIGAVEVDGIGKNGGNYEFINKTFVYKIIESCSGNSCGGNVKFEDQVPPIIQCPMDVVFSGAEVVAPTTPLPQSSGTPRLTDCSPTSFTYIDQLYETNCLTPFTALPAGVSEAHSLPNSGDIYRIIVRTFIGRDIWGNTSTGEQLIFIRRANVKNVICPRDIEYECQSVPPNLDPSVTGVPMFDVDGDVKTVNDRYALGQAVQMFVRYTDDTFYLCGGSYQITRTWTILSLCSPDDPNTIENESRKICTQNITVLDKTPPVVNAYFTQHYTHGGQLLKQDTVVPFDGYYIVNGGSFYGYRAHVYPISLSEACGGSVRLRLKANDLNCLNGGRVSFTVDDARMKISSGYPQFNSQTGETTVVFEGTFMNIGEYVFTIEAQDECGFALSKKTFRVLVRDNLNPQALCLNNLSVKLDNNGIARVPAVLLNSGSFDNCGTVHFDVRRLENCQYPADTLYKPYIDFYCCDAGKSHWVTLKVSDDAGNFSECSVNIKVDDNMKPTCYAPIATTISCEKLDMTNLSPFGEPALWDNCAINDTIYSVTKNVNPCGVGTVTRQWAFSDISGNRDSCSQTITVTGKSDFTVDFPDDMVADCFASVPSVEQMRQMMLTNSPDKDGHIINNGCGEMYVDIKDDTLKNVPGACYLILRKIRVMDWCQFSLNTGSSDYAQGVMSFTQKITITDNTPPQYIAGSDTIIKAISNGCQTTVNLEVKAEDPCKSVRLGDDVLSYTWKLVEKNQPNTVLSSGNGNMLTTTLSFGKDFIVLWTVLDRCGNPRTKSQNVQVVDAKKPLIQCLNKTAQLTGGNGEGSVTVNVSDMVQGLSDNCSSEAYLRSKLAIIKISESGNSYPLVPLSALTFICQDAGKKIPVQIWTMDEAGNTDYCTAEISIEDKNDVCFIAPAAAIYGTTKTESGKTVKNVTLSAVQNGNILSSMMTTSTGGYTLGNLVQGQNYQVRASKKDNPANGVSTFDIALISRHLLGIQSFTTPYKMIAADVNRDGEITAADMLFIRKLVLRSLPEFPNNTSWRFVDNNFVFTDMGDPFSSDFAEVINVSSIGQTAQANFVAIKVGDVNGSVNPLNVSGSSGDNIEMRSSETLTFEVENIEMKAGVEYTIPFTVHNFNALGFQFTINYATLGTPYGEGVECMGVLNGNLKGMDNNNFGKFKNALTTSWNGSVAETSVQAFSLVLKAAKNVKLSDILTIGSNITTAEAYNTNSERIAIGLKFNNSEHSEEPFTLYQNEPNPFESETKISFNVPQPTMGKLTIYDATGRVMKTMKTVFDKGYNDIIVPKSDLHNAGVYFYRIDTPTHSATKKMILVN